MKNLVLSHFTTWHFLQFAKKHLIGACLVDAYSVSKEQTVFEFETANGPLFLLTYFSGHNAFYWTQDSYGKPRSKYNTKFKALHGLDIDEVLGFENERSFSLTFGDRALVFALFGRLNVILNISKPNDNIWQVAVSDRSISTFVLNQTLNTELDFLSLVYGKKTGNEELIEFGENIKKGAFGIASNEKGQLVFGYGFDKTIYTTDKVEDALQFYSKTWFTTFQLEQLKNKIDKYLSQEKRKTEKALKAAENQLIRIKNSLNYRNWADLLMANLHNIDTGEKQVALDDFYTDNKISIPLKSKLSAQENAANYYRKAKNQGKEIGNLNARIERSFNRLEEIEVLYHAFKMAREIKELKLLEREIFGNTNKTNQLKESRFLEFEIDGFKVYVGRNSKNNDELTLGFAGKNDLWLHAKDLAGSHVIIRNKGSQSNYPKYVIEQAAQIAAYYSKGRNQEFCPVLYTPKKYIRKPKGAPAGAVLVDREDVVLVRPGLLK